MGKDVKISISQDENFKKTISSDENILKNILQDLLEVILKAVDMGDIDIHLSNPDEEFIAIKKSCSSSIHSYITF